MDADGDTAFRELSAFSDPFEAFRPLETDSPNLRRLFNTYALGTLSILPREVRDIIYSDVVSFGKMNILRTSKTVCQEVMDLLYEEGICRVNVDNDRLLPQFHLTKALAKKIQNLHIRLTVSSRLGFSPNVPRTPNPIKKFRGYEIPRQVCHVIIEFNCESHPIFWRVGPRKFIRFLGSLTSFAKMTVRVAVIDRVDPRSQKPWPMDTHTGIQKKYLHLTKASLALEKSLGEGIYCSESGRETGFRQAQYLEFYPQDHLKSLRDRQLPEKGLMLLEQAVMLCASPI